MERTEGKWKGYQKAGVGRVGVGGVAKAEMSGKDHVAVAQTSALEDRCR